MEKFSFLSSRTSEVCSTDKNLQASAPLGMNKLKLHFALISSLGANVVLWDFLPFNGESYQNERLFNSKICTEKLCKSGMMIPQAEWLA